MSLYAQHWLDSDALNCFICLSRLTALLHSLVLLHCRGGALLCHTFPFTDGGLHTDPRPREIFVTRQPLWYVYSSSQWLPQVPSSPLGYFSTTVLIFFTLIQYNFWTTREVDAPWNSITDSLALIGFFTVATLCALPIMTGTHPRAKNILMLLAVCWLTGMGCWNFWQSDPFTGDGTFDHAAALCTSLQAILGILLLISVVVTYLGQQRRLTFRSGTSENAARQDAAFALTYVVELFTPPPAAPGQPVATGCSYEYIDLQWEAPRFKAFR